MLGNELLIIDGFGLGFRMLWASDFESCLDDMAKSWFGHGDNHGLPYTYICPRCVCIYIYIEPYTYI